jgi:L-galactose dehydrogenase
LAEERLGKALDNKRHEIYLATKCGRYGLHEFDFSYDRVLTSIDESLRRLKTDYVDVFQLHDIEFVEETQILNEAIPAALKAKEMGKARFIGITGLPVRYLAHICRQVEVDTVLSWAHYNLLEDEINDELVPLSKKKGFGLMNAGPLLQRILSDAAPPQWHRSPKVVKEVQPLLIELCKSYDLQLSDVAIRYAVDHPDIATTIAGLSDARRVKQNVDALNLHVPDGLLKEIRTVVAPVKNLMWYEGKPGNNIPKI